MGESDVAAVDYNEELVIVAIIDVKKRVVDACLVVMLILRMQSSYTLLEMNWASCEGEVDLFAFSLFVVVVVVAAAVYCW